jgi:hypothetical protein
LGEKGGFRMEQIKTDARALQLILDRSIAGNIEGRIVVWHQESAPFVPVKIIHWERVPNASFIEVELPGKRIARFDLLSYAIPLSVDM